MQHTWKIYDLKRTISSGVVTEVKYACESSHEEHSRRKIGDISITGSASDPGFVAFEDLTEETVLGWITGSIDTSSIEVELSSSIANTINEIAAVTEANGKPWDN